jgi:predicted ArsR family transcriptional regulator
LVVDRKQAALAYLKGKGQATLEDVAGDLGLSKQGTLRHLDALVAEGLVQAGVESAHEHRGRPRHVYRLTSAAAERFPHAHRELASELVHFLPAAQLERFFADRRARLEAEYGRRLAGKTGRERVEELARLATEKGHMADVVELADGSLGLRHCNCPIGDVAAETRHPCAQEQAMYARLLGVEVKRSTFMPEGDPVCTYVISAPVSGRTKLSSRSRRLTAATN